jgi:hypothetical protein
LDNNPFIEGHDLCVDVEAEFALKIFLVEEDSGMRVLFRDIGKISRGMPGVHGAGHIRAHRGREMGIARSRSASASRAI